MDATSDVDPLRPAGLDLAANADHAPLTAWVCDVCGELITDPARGMVVARHEPGTHLAYDFLLVHRRIAPYSCDPGSEGGYVHHLDIDQYLGPDGLTRLLAYLSLWPLKNGGGGVRDLDEFVDLIRRLQTPWYEEARGRFADQDVLAALRGADDVYPYLTSVLQQIATGL